MIADALEFTGERYTPECPREMLYEHYARYAMALEFVSGQRVLDCACGEGYGSSILANSAARVLGADISAKAIEHARRRYQKANLSFEVADATRLKLAAESVDVVVSFETLEHLSAQDEMLQGFKKVLTKEGLLLISSPDKHNYSDVTGYRNEFHVKELYRVELESLLARHFKHFRLFGQKLVFQSMIWDATKTEASSLSANSMTSESSSSTARSMRPDGVLSNGVDYPPMYYIAIASDDPIKIANCERQMYLFADQTQSLYAHYQAEIKNGIYAAQVIAQLRAEVAQLRAKLRDL